MEKRKKNFRTKLFTFFKSDKTVRCSQKTMDKENLFGTRTSNFSRLDATKKSTIKSNNEVMRMTKFPFELSFTQYNTTKQMHLQVHQSMVIPYVQCMTEGSQIVPVPLNLSNPVKYTTINTKTTFETINDVKMALKRGDITWIVVTQRFLYNSNVFEPGDILEVSRCNVFQKFASSLQKNGNKTDLTVVSHPNQVRSSLPSHIKGNFRKCDSPYNSYYRSLSDLMKTVDAPFLINLPVNTRTGEIINHGKVSVSTYNKRLLVLKKSILNLLLVHHENDDRIGVLNISNRDHFQVSENKSVKQIDFQKFNNLDFIKQKIMSNLKKIYEADGIFYLDEKFSTLKRSNTIKKNKSFKRKFSSKNNENENILVSAKVQNGDPYGKLNDKTDTTHKLHKERKLGSSRNFSGSKQSLLHNMPNFMRLSNPILNQIKVPSYQELLQKEADEDMKLIQSDDAGEYLVPMNVNIKTGFENPLHEVGEANILDERAVENHSDSDIEVGDDGYVLVTPSKHFPRKKQKHSYDGKHTFDGRHIFYHPGNDQLANGNNNQLNERHKTRHDGQVIKTNDSPQNRNVESNISDFQKAGGEVHSGSFQRPLVPPKPPPKKMHSISQRLKQHSDQFSYKEITESQTETTQKDRQYHQRPPKYPYREPKAFVSVINSFEQIHQPNMIYC